MSIYDLPKFEPSKIQIPKFLKSRVFGLLVLVVLVSFVSGFLGGAVSGGYFYQAIRDSLSKLNIELPGSQTKVEEKYSPQTTQEELIIRVVEKVSPAVVSIVVTKDVPILEEYYISPFEEFEQFFGPSPFQFKIPQYRQKGTQKQEIGGGTGFIISEDGMVATNKHVVSETQAYYTVLTNDGKKFPAKVLAIDPVQDLAILKIEPEKTVDQGGNFTQKSFSVVTLGDSSKIQIGQTVVAIGNALGEFRNTVSVGVGSGLGRMITASGGGVMETLEDVIQTDTAINKGNSGGPLLNLRGEVIGINAAMAQEAQSIGFSIPINKVKKAIEQVRVSGKITYPLLGISYVSLNETIQKENNLPVDRGAWITKGSQNTAIVQGSAAEKAGLKENDIILEINGEKITPDNSLAKIILKYNPGDAITLKVLRGNKEIELRAVLGERSE